VIVVKVGGSLFDHPGLGPGLSRWLADRGRPALLVPGGGPAADAVRDWDRVHGLGDAASHWLAIRSLSLTAALLHRLLPGSVIVDSPRAAIEAGLGILDPFAFCRADDTLPHSWDVTSDSIAARAAVIGDASRLVLLKSIDILPGIDWPTVVANKWVDAYFPRAVVRAAFPIEFVNFRKWLISNKTE
jgi:aspartokinase-like uncharacterized kinase